MNLQMTTPYHSATFLRRALQADSLFSGASGILLAVASQPLAAFLGLDNAFILVELGIALLLYAAALYWQAGQETLNRWFTIAVIDLNILWVIGSVLLLFTNWVSFTSAGWWAVALVADAVAVFAILQYVGLRRMN